MTTNAVAIRPVPLAQAILASLGILLATRAQASLDRLFPLDGVLFFALAVAMWLVALALGYKRESSDGGGEEPGEAVEVKTEPGAALDVEAEQDEALDVEAEPREALGVEAEQVDLPVPAPAKESGAQLPGLTANLDGSRIRFLLIGLSLVILTALVFPKLGTAFEGLSIIRFPDQGAATNTLNPFGFLIWAAGLGCYIYALADWEGTKTRWRAIRDRGALAVRLDAATVLLIGIVLVAAYFRFYHLSKVPLEMTSDHTEKLLDVRDVVAGLRPVYLPRNAGREPFEFYWIAFLVSLGFPISFLTLKFGMGVVSTLNIPVVYKLGREVAGRWVGLTAALILALAPWHIQITRAGLRIAFSPLFATLTLLFLFRALKHGRRNDWLATGCCLGAGLYGYSGFRTMFFAVPVITLLKLGHDLWHRRGQTRWLRSSWRPMVQNWAAAAGGTMLIAAPMIRYALDQPASFWGRTLTRMTGAEVPIAHPWQQFFINWKQALLMFNVTSDSAWFHSPPGRPALETVGGALFVLGLVTAVWWTLRGGWRAGMLIVVIPFMLLSSVLALAFAIEVPHLSRAAGAIPAVVLLAALPFPFLVGRWRAALGPLAGLVAALVFAWLLFLPMAQNTWERYFIEYDQNYTRSTHPMSRVVTVTQGFLDLGGDLNHVYIVGWPNGWDYRIIGISLGEPGWNGNLWTGSADGSGSVELAAAHKADPARKLYFVGGPLAQSNIDYLRKLYPLAIVTHHAVPVEGKDYWSVLVPESGPGTTGK